MLRRTPSPPVLRLPGVKRCVADPVLATKVRRLRASLMLAQHANNLFLGKSASPHHSSPSDELTYQWHDFWGAGQNQPLRISRFHLTSKLTSGMISGRASHLKLTAAVARSVGPLRLAETAGAVYNSVRRGYEAQQPRLYLANNLRGASPPKTEN